MPVHLPAPIFDLATACAFSSVIVSSALIYLHLKNYRKPLEQRLIVRILLLLPLYALTCWLGLFEATREKPSLILHLLTSLLEPLEEAYEALVIYTFFSLLTQLLGGERNLVLKALGRAPKPHPGMLGKYLPLIDISDPYTFLTIKRGSLQYVWIKPLLSVLMLITKLTHTYHDGYISWTSGYAWIGAVYNISVSISLYSLALFWYTLNEDLKPFDPMPKFLCIKLVIFFSYWQGVLLAIAGWFGLIPEDQTGDGGNEGGSYSSVIQNTLMCIEMIGFSIGHWYAFNYKEFSEDRLVTEIREKQTVMPLLSSDDEGDDEGLGGGGGRRIESVKVVTSKVEWKLARLPLPYAIRDVFGCLDLLLDFKATFTGEEYTYRHFDISAKTVMEHPLAAKSREKKIRQGMRYAQGGKAKYWLPDANQVSTAANQLMNTASSPTHQQGYGSISNNLSTSHSSNHSSNNYSNNYSNNNYSNHNSSSTLPISSTGSVYRSDTNQQKERYCDRLSEDSEREISYDIIPFLLPEEAQQDDELYNIARKLPYGDYNFPVITSEPIPTYEPIQPINVSTRDPRVRRQLESEYQSFLRPGNDDSDDDC